MKNYKYILEAINRGIKLALDDYEEQLNEPIIPKKDIIRNNNSTKELLDLHNQFVDLGLPSGTMWAKWNLGVDPSKLNTDKDWYGNYYAWGELKSKNEYSWETYKIGTKDNLTKYNKKDGLTELLLEDDVAYQFDNRMKMPTKELFEELLKCTDSKWVENYLKIKGLNGGLFSSKINKNLIFIPATGFKYQDVLDHIGSSCDLWSSSLKTNSLNYAWSLYFYSGSINIDYYDSRYYGLAIRPVLNRN